MKRRDEDKLPESQWIEDRIEAARDPDGAPWPEWLCRLDAAALRGQEKSTTRAGMCERWNRPGETTTVRRLIRESMWVEVEIKMLDRPIVLEVER